MSSAAVVSLRKHKLKRARASVKRSKLFRLEGELLLIAAQHACAVLQADLDRAVEKLRQQRRKRA
jgi:hypothetical protein